jgi:hypothetical protein
MILDVGHFAVTRIGKTEASAQRGEKSGTLKTNLHTGLDGLAKVITLPCLDKMPRL